MGVGQLFIAGSSGLKSRCARALGLSLAPQCIPAKSVAVDTAALQTPPASPTTALGPAHSADAPTSRAASASTSPPRWPAPGPLAAKAGRGELVLLPPEAAAAVAGSEARAPGATAVTVTPSCWRAAGERRSSAKSDRAARPRLRGGRGRAEHTGRARGQSTRAEHAGRARGQSTRAEHADRARGQSTRAVKAGIGWARGGYLGSAAKRP